MRVGSRLRERVLRAAAGCFDHRLMMDCIVPGGVAADLAPDGAAQLHDLLTEIGRIFIENSRHHAGLIASAIARRLSAVTA